MNRLAVFSAILCLLGCGGDLSATSCESFSRGQIDRDGSVSFCIRLQNGTEVDNVMLMRDRIDGVLVLQYRGHNGLEVRGLTSRENEQDESRFLSIDEFVELLDSTYGLVSQETEGATIRRIQFDAILVRDTWQELVAAVSRATADLDGKITPKVRVVDEAALHVILQSRQLEQTCAILRKHDQACLRHVSVNPIVFQPDVLGKSWGDLRSLKYHGISESTWFGVTVQQSKED